MPACSFVLSARQIEQIKQSSLPSSAPVIFPARHGLHVHRPVVHSAPQLPCHCALAAAHAYRVLAPPLSAADQASTPEELALPEVRDESAAQQQGRWLAQHLQLWADEEWTPQDVHARLADRTAEVYAALRLEGDNDIGSLILGISSRLQAFNFRDTFTSNFEVANKVAELLMEKEGREVCCQSAEDKERFTRGEAEFANVTPEM